MGDRTSDGHDGNNKAPSGDARLTTRQGHPVADNQNQRTVGSRGPATLENYQFLEKISHFDRERIPERVVHARGFVAHGHFDAYGTMWVGAADYLNYNPYVCFVADPSTCDYAWEDHVLEVAESLGQPYFVALQAFKEGTWWRWPTAAEETQMLQKLCGTSAKGYLTFSWNWQNDPLLNHPDVLDAIKQFNLNGCSPPATPPSAPSRLASSSTASSTSAPGT